MPTVPVISQPTVAPARESERFTTFRATADQFDTEAGARQDLARFSEGMTKVAELFGQLQDRQDATDFNEAKVNYDNEVTNLMYGDGSPENPGVLNMKGDQALRAGAEARESLQHIASDITDRYNPAVQSRLTVAIGASNARHQANLVRHMATQRDVYDQQLSDARKQAAASDAARAFADPRMVAEQVATAKIMVVGDAKRNGYSPEVQKHETQNAVDLVLRQAFTAALKNQDPKSAEVLLDKFGSQVSGPILAEMNNMLRTSSQLKASQDHSDRIMGTAGLTPAQRLAEARKIKEPEVRKLVVADISRRNTEEANVSKQASLMAVQNVMRAMVQQGVSIAQWGQANPEMYDKLITDPDEFGKVLKFQDSLAEGRIYSRTSDGKTLAQFKQMNNDQLAAVTDTQMETHKASLTETEWNDLIDMVHSARVAADKTSKSSAAFKRGEQLLRLYAPPGLGLREGEQRGTIASIVGDKEETAKLQNTVRNELNKWINTFVAQGRVPTDEQIRAQVQALFLPFESKEGWFFDTDFSRKRSIAAEIRNATPEERAKFRIDLDEVSSFAKNELKRLYQNRLGRDPSEAEMEQFFRAEALNDTKTQRNMLNVSAPAAPATPEPAGQEEETPAAAPASAPDIPRISPPQEKQAQTKDFFKELATIESGPGGAEALAGGGRIRGAEDMTIAEVARRAGTKAAGLYQIKFLVPRAVKAGLNPNKDKFTPENQKKIARYLIKQRGVTKKMIAEDLDEAVNRLAREWAAIPVTKDQKGAKQRVKAGETYYKGIGGNKALMTVEEARELVKSLGG